MPMNLDWLYSERFIACAMLCGLYALVNVLTLRWFKDDLKSLGKKFLNIAANATVYSLFVSIPFMPFISGFSPEKTLYFVICNFILQIAYLCFAHKSKWRDLIVPLSVSNMMGWVVMYAVLMTFMFRFMLVFPG